MPDPAVRAAAHLDTAGRVVASVLSLWLSLSFSTTAKRSLCSTTRANSKQPEDKQDDERDQGGKQEQGEIDPGEEDERCRPAAAANESSHCFPQRASFPNRARFAYSGNRQAEPAKRDLHSSVLGGTAGEQNLIGGKLAKRILDRDHWVGLPRAPLGLIPTALLALLFDLKARREEAWLMERFPKYAAYRARTPRRFVPWLY